MRKIRLILAALVAMLSVVFLGSNAYAASAVGNCGAWSYGSVVTATTSETLQAPPHVPNSTDIWYWEVYPSGTTQEQVCSFDGLIGYSQSDQTTGITDGTVIHAGDLIFSMATGNGTVPSAYTFASTGSGSTDPTPAVVGPLLGKESFFNPVLVAFTDYTIPTVLLVLVVIVAYRLIAKNSTRFLNRA